MLFQGEPIPAWRPAWALWMSSTESGGTQTDAYITGVAGMTTEIQKLGEAATSISNFGNGATPYPARLRPMSDLAAIRDGNTYLIGAHFHALDTTLTSGSGQDATTVAAIYASRTTSDAYAQSVLINGEVPLIGQTFFRPRLWIDGINIFDSLSRSNFGNKGNAGDLSIGVPLPFCPQFPYPIHVGNINSIQIDAQAGQPVGAKVQRYAILCLLDFIVKAKSDG